MDLTKAISLATQIFSEAELLIKVADQIKKDFRGFEEVMQISFDSDSSQKFLEHLSQVLSFLSKKDPECFLQSIYMVDLPERIFSGFYKSNEICWEEFVEYVYRREVLKVYLKAKLSGH